MVHLMLSNFSVLPITIWKKLFSDFYVDLNDEVAIFDRV